MRIRVNGASEIKGGPWKWMVHMLQGMVARLIRGSKDALALLREVSAQGETRPLCLEMGRSRRRRGGSAGQEG